MHTPKLSDTARSVLFAASTYPDQLATAPVRLPVVAQRAVMQSLLKAGLLDETEAEDNQLALRISKAGLEAITPALGVACDTKLPVPEAREVGAPQGDLPADTLNGPARPELRAAAQAVLEAWDANPAPDRSDLDDPLTTLRTALAHAARSASNTPRQPRSDTKRAMVLAILLRPKGATVAQVVEATGCARHTVHGFFAGLKKQGIQIDVLERVRQVGAGQGAKGSYTVYRAEEAA